MIEFTAGGYIELWCDGAVVSRHRVEREAIESAAAHGPGIYELRFPTVHVIIGLPVSAPDAPELGTPIVTSTTMLTVPLARATSGPTALDTYVLERSPISVSWAEIARGADIFGTAGFVDSGLTPDTTYYYRAKAIDTNGRESEYCAVVAETTAAVVGTDTTALPAPALNTPSVTGLNVTLSWSAVTDPTVSGQTTSGLKQYNVRKNGAFLTSVAAGTTTYTDASAVGVHTYTVRSEDNAGNKSGDSNTVQATVAQPGTSAIDWNPGHYIQAFNDSTWPATTDVDNVIAYVNARSYLKGIVIRRYWSALESTPGNYTFDIVDHAINALNSDKRVWLQLQLVRFNTSSSDGSQIIPAYLTSPTYSGGVFADEKSPGLYDLNTKVWLPSVMGRYVALITELGQRYNATTKFAGFVNSEMTFGSNLDNPAANFDGATHIDLITDSLIPGIRAAMPAKCFMFYMNFLSDGNDVPDKFERVRDAIRAYDGIISGPDTDPAIGGKRGMQYARGVQGSPAVDCRGLIGIGCGCQFPDLGSTSSLQTGNSPGWTGQQYIEWMYGTQQITHGVWAYYPNSGKLQGALSYIQANPSLAYVSTYPSEYP